jgi:hypothetical protein
MELNPGFDGKVTRYDGTGTPVTVKGVLREMAFLTDKRDRYFAGESAVRIGAPELRGQRQIV